jgi:hypothetical protein
MTEITCKIFFRRLLSGIKNATLTGIGCISSSPRSLQAQRSFNTASGRLEVSFHNRLLSKAGSLRMIKFSLKDDMAHN